MLAQLIQIVEKTVKLPSEEEEKLRAISKVKSVLKGYHFIREGQVPSKFAFVGKGLFRYYYTDKKGNELTKGFFPENSFITAYSAIVKGIGSYYNIEALEDSDIVIIDFEKWKVLASRHSSWNLFLISLLEKGYLKKEKREREFLLFDAEERYKSFLEEYPHLEIRIKQHHIASYLGITPVALSRVRKKMGIINIG
jgi:CRP-like cAMP-binding protein